MGRGITCTFLCFIVLISLVIPKGLSDDHACPPEKIEIVETYTSRTDWKVSVKNTCTCTVYNVQLLCPKFEFAVVSKKDQSLISAIDKSGKCLLNKGGVLVGEAISFAYTGERVDFAVDTYSIACS
ncbi:hypothetical protein ABFS83_06G148300 [Erythranthe nasuta]